MSQKTFPTISASVDQLLLISPFVFPLYLMRFSVYGIPLTVLEVFCYLLFAVWLLAVIQKKVRLDWSKPLRYYWLLVFLILVGATIGVLTAPHFIALPSGAVLDAQRTSLGVWKGWVLAPMLYFAVLTQWIRSENQVTRILRNFVYSAAAVSLIAYFLGILGTGFTYDFRLSGFFESANYLSLYIVPALLLSVHFLIYSDGKEDPTHYLNLSSLVILAHTLYFTKSYAAIIGVFGALFLHVGYMVLRSRVNLKNLVFGILGIFCAFAFVLYTQIHTPKFQQFLDIHNRSSSSVRLEVYEIAWGLINDQPLTGIGPGLFQAYYQTRGPVILGHPPMEWNIPHPHNIFFAFWLNAGLLGLLGLLVIVFLIHFPVRYPLIAMWGILIHGIFDAPFWKNDLAMIFWLILASIVILQRYAPNTPKSTEGPIRKRLAPKLIKSTR